VQPTELVFVDRCMRRDASKGDNRSVTFHMKFDQHVVNVELTVGRVFTRCSRIARAGQRHQAWLQGTPVLQPRRGTPSAAATSSQGILTVGPRIRVDSQPGVVAARWALDTRQLVRIANALDTVLTGDTAVALDTLQLENTVVDLGMLPAAHAVAVVGTFRVAAGGTADGTAEGHRTLRLAEDVDNDQEDMPSPAVTWSS
jgi:hypothetical protein